MPDKPGKLCAMISSTAADLPEHREQVKDAYLRTGIFPIGMEQIPARDATGIKVSLEMVDKADIYIGIYAWRYGWVPDGAEISITEMEFNRALERKERGKLKEILIFLMHENHPLTSAKMVEADAPAQTKLASFKQRAAAGRVVWSSNQQKSCAGWLCNRSPIANGASKRRKATNPRPSTSTRPTLSRPRPRPTSRILTHCCKPARS